MTLAALGGVVGAVVAVRGADSASSWAGRLLPGGDDAGREAVGAGTPTGASRAGIASTSATSGSPAASGDPTGGTGPSGAAAPGSGGAARPTLSTRLPRGGTTLFPRYRLIGYSGGPGAAAFGRLGVGDLDDRAREIEALGAQYAAGREPLPVLELIAVVAQRFPGDDGQYRVRLDDNAIGTYLDAARRHGALLLLNIQPGRAAFLDEARALEKWLQEPDVGLALDPEWAVRAPQRPGQVFGHTTGAEVDAVSAYLAGLVTGGGLPQKALVIHQLAPSVLTGLTGLRERPEVATVKSVDGIGSPGAKTSTWRKLMRDMPNGIRPGFKLFFDEDRAQGARLMTPAEVLALTPRPDYVLYE